MRPLALFVALSLCVVAEAQPNSRYVGLKHSSPPTGTWGILDRDGANRAVDKHLSSLAGGEPGVGALVSPPFRVAVDRIAFALCGHDGPQGGQKKNYLALVDAASGATLRQAFAPGSDAMRPGAFDVGDLRDREVRLAAHDGDSGGAYAWMGVGLVDAGPALNVDFRQGLPGDWTIRAAAPPAARVEILAVGVPFARTSNEYSWFPASGEREIPCGLTAQRVFVLGGAVAAGRPLERPGTIEIAYRDGQKDRFPLIVGYNLDIGGKLLSPSKALHLHPSADPFQHYFVLVPRATVIDKMVLRREATGELPRVTAITCLASDGGDDLVSLPSATPDAAEQAWIEQHGIRADAALPKSIEDEIRRAHRLP